MHTQESNRIIISSKYESSILTFNLCWLNVKNIFRYNEVRHDRRKSEEIRDRYNKSMKTSQKNECAKRVNVCSSHKFLPSELVSSVFSFVFFQYLGLKTNRKTRFVDHVCENTIFLLQYYVSPHRNIIVHHFAQSTNAAYKRAKNTIEKSHKYR